jgi:CheY-like chemotaxis protein
MDQDADWIARLGGVRVLKRSVRQQSLLEAVRLPAQSPAAVPPAVAAPAPVVIVAASSEYTALNVLFVEDNPVNQLLGLHFLRSLGAQATLAENGLQALAAIEANAFDLVLMDWHLPEMDGLEATRRIRAREAESGGRRVPIVAVTANAMQGDRERCFEAGADDYLAKPYRIEQLRALIERHCAAAA